MIKRTLSLANVMLFYHILIEVNGFTNKLVFLGDSEIETSCGLPH